MSCLQLKRRDVRQPPRLECAEVQLADITVSGSVELHQAFAQYRKSNRWVFRGHARVDWLLVPKAGRPEFSASSPDSYFEAWRRLATQFPDMSAQTEWDWLATAQHHGLATRLLDWTYNPLVAAYFAVCEEREEDAVIYAFYPNRYARAEDVSPTGFDGIGMWRPRGVAQRIVRQGGVFTIHGPPNLPVEGNLAAGEELDRIVVQSEYARELVFELAHYGIHRMSLFPDPDGLSAHVNWYMRHRAYWAAVQDDWLDLELLE